MLLALLRQRRPFSGWTWRLEQSESQMKSGLDCWRGASVPSNWTAQGEPSLLRGGCSRRSAQRWRAACWTGSTFLHLRRDSCCCWLSCSGRRGSGIPLDTSAPRTLRKWRTASRAGSLRPGLKTPLGSLCRADDPRCNSDQSPCRAFLCARKQRRSRATSRRRRPQRLPAPWHRSVSRRASWEGA
jgi:hypothetical protein